MAPREDPGIARQWHRTTLAALCAWLTVAMTAASATCAELESSAIELDLSGSRTRCRAEARKLLSSDVGTWREAQARLAAAGPEGLRAIDDPRVLRSATGRLRAIEVIRVALLVSVPFEELKSRPRLMDLVADSIEHAVRLMATLPERPMAEPGPELGLLAKLDSIPRVSSRPNTVDAALGMGGFAVPPLLVKLHDPDPEVRAYACKSLDRLSAAAQLRHVDALTTDTEKFSWDQGCYYEQTEVAVLARSAVARLRELATGRFRFEQPAYLLAGPTLINGLRGVPIRSAALAETTRALYEAETWDEWWEGARPAWSDWWRLAGDGRTPIDLEAWHNVVAAYEGYQLHRQENDLGRCDVEIVGPSGTHCRIVCDGVELASGLVPLTYVRAPGPKLPEGDPLAMEATEDDWYPFEVDARLPSGRAWSGMFSWGASRSYKLELLAEPKAVARLRTDR